MCAPASIPPPFPPVHVDTSALLAAYLLWQVSTQGCGNSLATSTLQQSSPYPIRRLPLSTR